MAKEIQAHDTNTSMVKAALAEVDAGSDIALKVKVLCSPVCNLVGKIVRIITEDSVVVKEVELTEFDGTVNETDEFVVNAPANPGGCQWAVVFPAQEKEGILHEESSAPFSFIVMPHATSVEVWDVPSPVAFGDEFRIKVGVKCSAECKLTGEKIEVYDDEGAKVATSTLGEVPWSNATAQSCAEVGLKAPSVEGRYRWTVKFPKPDLKLPHEGASCTFAFGAASHPEHVVTVEVIDDDTKAPVKNALVLVRTHVYRGITYRSYTDDSGVAKLSVPKDEYQLCASGGGKEALEPMVRVDSDVTVKVELAVREPDWG